MIGTLYTELVNDAVFKITELVQFVINKSTKKTKNKKVIPRKSWMTRQLIDASIKKEKLYSIHKKSPLDLVAKEKYKNFLKQYEKSIKEA